jgi:osmotically inducible protein OsmC
MKKLYEAVVTSKGGRNGWIKTDDDILDFAVAVPKEMGGKGEATNPEQLFGAAYASCFENALIHFAPIHNIKLEGTSVTAFVAVLADEKGAFNLEVKLEVTLIGCDNPEKLVKIAHAACPYSKAVRNNIPVEIIIK